MTGHCLADAALTPARSGTLCLSAHPSGGLTKQQNDSAQDCWAQSAKPAAREQNNRHSINNKGDLRAVDFSPRIPIFVWVVSW